MFELLSNTTLETAKSGLAILGVILAIPGAIQCFFGYRVLKLYITLMGFLVGLLGFSIIGVLAAGSMGPGLLVGLLGGALLAFIAFKLHKLAVCLINGANAMLGMTILGFASGVEYALRCLEPAAIQEHTGAGLIVGLAVGVIVAVLTAFLYRPVVILSTSLQGGVFLGCGLCMMLFALDIFPLVILVCTLLGAIFQFYNTRAEGRAAKEARRQERQSWKQARKDPTYRAQIRQTWKLALVGIGAAALALVVWNIWGRSAMLLLVLLLALVNCVQLRRRDKQRQAPHMSQTPARSDSAAGEGPEGR